MYGKKLTDQEIQARLVEGQNYKRLYRQLKPRFDKLKTENKMLLQLVALQQAQLDKQAIQITELQTMVFGKKKKPPMGGKPLAATPKIPRSKASYQRPIPPVPAITAEVVVPLPETCVCGSSFDHTKTTIHERFVEDIPLPELTPGYQAHSVTKYQISRGICLKCGKATSARDLGGAQVALGPNVRLLVTHLVSLVGMSYAQAANLLLSLYGLVVSDGEIAAMLQKQHQTWLPAYEQLKTDIRAAPAVHADETSWPIAALQGAGYAWVLADSGSPKSCYVLASSRGAPHAKRLLGTYTGIRITDDYGVYRSEALPGSQQLCWAHLYRVVRDLRYNQNLPKDQLPYVTWWHNQFAAIYQDLRLYLDQPYDVVVRQTHAQELWQRTQVLASQASPEAVEPDKLRKLKAQLLRAGKQRLFICLSQDTPCDNNRAERDLRQLVLKRKRSFGSKTEQGAQALATVFSLCTTTWRTRPNNYFQQLALLG